MKPAHAIAKTTLELMLAQAIRKPIADPSSKIYKYVVRATAIHGLRNKYLVGQVEQWEREAIKWVAEFLEIFDPSKYLPVSGPMPWRIKVNKTPVEIGLSGIYRQLKNKTIHVLYFTPYSSVHDQLNDPIVHLLLQTVRGLVAPHGSGRAQSKLHLLGFGAGGKLIYSSLDSAQADKNYVSMVKRMVESIENGHNYPAVPCPDSKCPFKNRCSPRV